MNSGQYDYCHKLVKKQIVNCNVLPQMVRNQMCDAMFAFLSSSSSSGGGETTGETYPACQRTGASHLLCTGYLAQWGCCGLWPWLFNWLSWAWTASWKVVSMLHLGHQGACSKGLVMYAGGFLDVVLLCI